MPGTVTGDGDNPARQRIARGGEEPCWAPTFGDWASRSPHDKFDEGLWFPVSYGSEFEVKALFFYKRKIAVSLRNTGFQRAQVAAKVSFDEPLQIDKTMKVQEIKAPVNPPPNP